MNMIFMLGILPWYLVSALLGCGVAMLVIRRIRKKMNVKESVTAFTISYMVFIILSMLLLNSLSIGA